MTTTAIVLTIAGVVVGVPVAAFLGYCAWQLFSVNPFKGKK